MNYQNFPDIRDIVVQQIQIRRAFEYEENRYETDFSMIDIDDF